MVGFVIVVTMNTKTYETGELIFYYNWVDFSPKDVVMGVVVETKEAEAEYKVGGKVFKQMLKVCWQKSLPDHNGFISPLYLRSMDKLKEYQLIFEERQNKGV